MITFTILLAVVILTALVALAFGVGFLAAFGDIVVCGLILWGLVKLFRRKKK